MFDHFKDAVTHFFSRSWWPSHCNIWIKSRGRGRDLGEQVVLGALPDPSLVSRDGPEAALGIAGSRFLRSKVDLRYSSGAATSIASITSGGQCAGTRDQGKGGG